MLSSGELLRGMSFERSPTAVLEADEEAAAPKRPDIVGVGVVDGGEERGEVGRETAPRLIFAVNVGDGYSACFVLHSITAASQVIFFAQRWQVRGIYQMMKREL